MQESNPPDKVVVDGDPGDLSGKPDGTFTTEGDRIMRITHRNPDGTFGGDVEIKGGPNDGAVVPDVKINPPPLKK